MVFNFRMLRERGLFPNVPVRADHSWSVNSLVGYFADLRVENNHLVADLEITEPEALERWNRGTYRARSLEVGMYETNDESVFWPVVMGVAFVDIPAVEGLYRQQASPEAHVFATHMEETLVGTKQPAAPEDPTNPTVQPTDPPTQPGTTTEAESKPPVVPDPAEGRSEGAETEQARQPVTHGGRSATTFRVAGQPVSDFAAVQAHIDALEHFQRETRDENRRMFVRHLVADHKIAATQGESLTAHALSLDDTQWTAFTAVYENAPSLRLFGEFGNGVTNPSGEPPSNADEAAVLEETVAMHRRSGMTDEQVKQTPSYSKLEALRAATR